MGRRALACMLFAACDPGPSFEFHDAGPDAIDARVFHCAGIRETVDSQQTCAQQAIPDLTGSWLIDATTPFTFTVEPTELACLYGETATRPLTGYWSTSPVLATLYAFDGTWTTEGFICLTAAGDLVVRGHRKTTVTNGHEPIEYVDIVSGTLTRP